MGQGLSSSQLLSEVSAEALASTVEGLGPKYALYGKALRENAVDGELLDSLDESSFQETLEDLEVSRLHQRILTKEWLKWKERDRQLKDTLSGRTVSGSLPTSNKQIARSFAKGRPELLIDHNITLSEEERRDLIEAAASYELTEETPASELVGFDRTATKALELCNALYGGVHLIEDDGHFVVSARFYSIHDGLKELCKDRIHAPRELSRCYGAVLGDERDLICDTIDPGKSAFQIPEKSSEYMARILHTPEGKRIGVVCTEVDQEDGDEEERRSILTELAAEAEEQLRLRKALLSRTKTLQSQIHHLKVASRSGVVLPSRGPVRAITRQDLERRGPPPYPMPDEIAASGKPRRSAHLPLAQVNRATTEEMSHLPDNFFAAVDAIEGADRCPIPKDDMQRIAVTESLGLTELTHDHPIGLALKRLVTLGARLFDVSWAEISLHNHSDKLTLALFTSLTGDQKDLMLSYYQVIQKDESGEPWLMVFPENRRCMSLCNYTLSTKKTFTVHDVWSDESFKWIGKLNAFRFYSGSPVFVNGHVVATYCMMDFRTRPDFTQAHEMQQEQIAMMISQQIETWVLRRDMDKLEKERRLLETFASKKAPPEDHAALVFTDVEGSTALWEADSNAMNQAIALHDNIMRKCIAEHHGYEVATEGDAFHVAFHDAVDAVSFALHAQMALHTAEWSDAILVLPEACDNGMGFRGLRVRMAIHVGSVISRENEVSGRREYAGPTFHVGKSLEHMAHGGQILVTSDAWNVASQFSESKLGSPQVLDLGFHVLMKGKGKQDGLIAKQVLQVVPSSLAYDYMQHRMLTDKPKTNRMIGRSFPPVKSQRRLSASFHEAPFAQNQVTMVFVNTSQIAALYDDPSTILAVLSKRIGVLLTTCSGYQCKDFMLVFASLSDAVSFGLELQDYLEENSVANENLAGLVQVGVHEGTFSSMGPHKTTGRADYLGKVVNRAARVAGAASPGKVCLGIIVPGSDKDDDGCIENTVPLLNKSRASFEIRCQLKGVPEEMSLYICSRVDH